MATPAGGTASFITNRDADTEAIPVTLAGGIEVALGANVGLLNILNAVIDPATEQKQNAGIALLTTIDADTSKIPALGTAAMAASAPATIATDDTQFGAVGAAADPDGNIHGQLRSIAENTDNLETLLAVGTGAMASAQAVTIATDDTMMTALDTAVDLVNTNLGTLETDVEATETTLTNIEKCQMGNAAPTIDSYGNAAVNAATGARTEIIATPGANKQLWIYGLLLTVDTVDVTVTLESAANALSGAMPQADNGGFAIEPSGNFAMPFFKCNTNEAFNITMGTGVGDGIVSYAVVSV